MATERPATLNGMSIVTNGYKDPVVTSSQLEDKIASDITDTNTTKFTSIQAVKSYAVSSVEVNNGDLSVTKNGTTTNTFIPDKFGTSLTDGDTAAKEVTVPGVWQLVPGARLIVMFDKTNNAENPTLNVNGTGAKPIMYRGYPVIEGAFVSKTPYDIIYDGTNYQVLTPLFWVS